MEIRTGDCGQTPYRTQAAIEMHKPQNTYGLMRAKPPPKPHTCKTPGWFLMVFYILIGRPIHPGSMFRCSCGAFYLYYKLCGGNRWDLAGYSGTEDWIKLGGKYEKEDKD